MKHLKTYLKALMYDNDVLVQLIAASRLIKENKSDEANERINMAISSIIRASDLRNKTIYLDTGKGRGK